MKLSNGKEGTLHNLKASIFRSMPRSAKFLEREIDRLGKDTAIKVDEKELLRQLGEIECRRAEEWDSESDIYDKDS